MGDYKKRKVYLYTPVYRNMGVFLSRGVLLDKCHDIWGRFSQTSEISEEDLLYMPDESLKNSVAYRIHKVVGSLDTEKDKELLSSWFSKGVLKDLVKKGIVPFFNWDWCEYVDIDTTLYDEPVFPLKVRLERSERFSEKSQYCVHINTEPNTIGKHMKGKVFFPDKSWAETAQIFAGDAEVTIKFQNATFGFLFGHMLPIKAVSLEELKDFFWDSGIPGETIICKRHIEGIGDLYGREDYDTPFSIYIKNSQGKITTDNYQMSEIPKVWEKTVCDLILQDVFPEDFCLGEFITQHYKPSIFFDGPVSFLPLAPFSQRKPLQGRWMHVRSCGSGAGENLRVAVNKGIFDVYELGGQGIKMLIPSYSGCIMLAEYTLEEAEQLFQLAQDFNVKADEAIVQKLQKGRLRLR